MKGVSSSRTKRQTTALVVRDRILRGGERLWRFGDFSDLSFAAASQALSRLAREGEIQRLSKGVYYRPRPTTFGKSRPNPAAIRNLIPAQMPVFPAGVAAANLLGLSTQNPGRAEVATNRLSLPRKLIGGNVTIHTRRPEAWRKLSEVDAALLDFLRRRGETSELPAKETIRKVVGLLAEAGRFEKLLSVSESEPPRVRAMLGAIGQQLGKPDKSLRRLKATLNPLSKFDFGILQSLVYAPDWQARERG